MKDQPVETDFEGMTGYVAKMDKTTGDTLWTETESGVHVKRVKLTLSPESASDIHL